MPYHTVEELRWGSSYLVYKWPIYLWFHVNICVHPAAKTTFLKISFERIKCIYVYLIPINQLTRCNNFTNLLLDLYVWLNMFRVLLRPSSGAYNCINSLWFYHWSVAVTALLVVVGQTDSSRQQYGVMITRYCSCSCFVLLKMGDSDARNM
jgi:hypothetical protein